MTDTKGLSLEECVRRQVELEKTMQERFTHHLTYLSIDVVESTKIKAGVSESDVLYTFSEYHNYVKQAATKHGGKVIATSGDGIMAEFASEQAGVNAAVEICDAMPEFNRQRNLLGKPVTLRMGVNAGKVLMDADNRDGKLFSVAIDIAGHLQKLAKPGQLLVASTVIEKLENRDDFAEIPGDYPVQVFRYKHAPESPESQAVRLEMKLTLDPIKGRSVADLKPGDEILVYFPVRNEGNRKYLESLGVKEGRSTGVPATVANLQRTETGAFKVEVQFRPDLFGLDIVGTNQRIKVLKSAAPAAAPPPPAGFLDQIIAFFKNLFGLR